MKHGTGWELIGQLWFYMVSYRIDSSYSAGVHEGVLSVIP